ncbi:hypothetical protein Ddye_005066 [Dipteronia dyeriana]|uniref:DUF1985 domain-containing protein n=1 Tax=Dipteronia dyeriana TaxID=168575 RepID=A0AAD9XFM6_9ROSI|nr:hypothetical protein Ddye_005066 [Dipteronia dyeriana]
MDSCFGHFLRMHQTMQFSGTVVHRLLLREIHHDGSPYEMQFLLGNVCVRFSKIEFCLITGLKFGIIPDTSEYLEVENGIHQRCFGGQNEIKIEELKERVQQGQWTEQFDVVKLCLLLLLHVFLIGGDERGSVPIWQVRLVDNLDGFDAFPWGCLVYSYSIYGFKTALSSRRGRFEQRLRIKGKDKHPKEKYNIWGFSYALLIFALEVIPALAKEFATRRNVDPFPRILKWEFTRRPRPDKVKKIIKDRMFARPEITLTNQEVGKWYYEGVQNVDDLYPAPDALNNMLDENDVHEGGCSTNNHTHEQTRPTSTAEPSGITGVTDIPIPPRRRFRAGTIGGGVDHTVPPSIVEEVRIHKVWRFFFFFALFLH